MFIKRIPPQIRLAVIKALTRSGKLRAKIVAGMLRNSNIVIEQVFLSLSLSNKDIQIVE